MLLLIISVAALALGPVLYRLARRAGPAMSALDGFVMVAITGLVLLHVIPHAMAVVGLWAPVIAIIGFAGPSIVEHTLVRAAKTTHTLTLILAVIGLVIHAFLDGIALAPQAGAADDDGSLLAIAVVLHRLPVAVTLWWLLRPRIGVGRTASVLATLAGATVVGYALGESQAHVLDEQWLSLFQALVAGTLLHVVIHRPAPIMTPGDTDGTSHARQRLFAGFGALVAIAAVVSLSHAHLPSLAEHVEVGIGDAFFALSIETAPALLLAFALAGVAQVVLPKATLAWMRTGRAMSESVRGVVFGLPLPICSCGVIPLYQTLINQSVPATAAMAFLVATPELGIDAILISLPLLGGELTAVRVVCAALVALAVGYLVGRMADRLPVVTTKTDAKAQPAGFWPRMRAGLRFGFVEIVDHTGPWLLLGVAIASLLEPTLDGSWFARLPWGVDVFLFALIGMPTYVCASGATPLAAVLIHKGVSPGAAIAFLLAGPATNITTFGILASAHGRRVALAFAGVMLGMSVGAGLGVNLAFPDAGGFAMSAIADDHVSLLGAICLAALAAIFAGSLLRQGPRGMLGQILAPYGDDACDHDHDRDHDHDHGDHGSSCGHDH